MAEYQFGPVTSQVAQRVWPQIEPFIAKAIKRGGLEKAYLPIDVLCQIQRGEMTLWLAAKGEVIDGAVVTKIIHYPRCSTLNGFLVGGKNMKEWFAAGLPLLKAHAKSTGCIAIEGGARKGWVGFGFEITGVTLAMEI